jgi:excisionase family DNA binding protein
VSALPIPKAEAVAEGVAEPLLIDMGTLATWLACSRRHAWRMLASGRLPREVRLGHTVRFRAAEVRRWIESGCPPRELWEARRAAEGGRRP